MILGGKTALGFGAESAAGDSKLQIKRGLGANGAEGDPKPEMLKEGLGCAGLYFCGEGVC